jgi:hypothetical protein
MERIQRKNRPPSSTEKWSIQINAAWLKCIEAIFRTGQLLIDARDDLDHGQFGKMIERDLPFGPDTAQRLMAIARDERLRNAAHARHLPPSWTVLHALTQLSDERLNAWFADGTINPELKRKTVIAALEIERLNSIKVSHKTIRTVIRVPDIKTETTRFVTRVPDIETIDLFPKLEPFARDDETPNAVLADAAKAAASMLLRHKHIAARLGMSEPFDEMLAAIETFRSMLLASISDSATAMLH